MRSDIEIARAAKLKPIAEIAGAIGIPEEALHPYGRWIAKIDPDFLRKAAEGRQDGKLILVTAISPTPAGEGKTTTTVGLGDALNRIGKKTIVCLREPSLGPCFGMKGGAAGGGYAQVVPMDAINLHFTGDFHAITSAHNLLAAMVDNHIYWGNALGLDQRRIAWRRVLDMNDRALREVVVGLGGPSNGFTREDGFDITVASEVMAAFCLASDIDDLEGRLGRMVVGYTYGKAPVTAAELKAEGAMSALLKEAIKPNLVQTLEGSPALVHGGPFANIAHGCNSVVATKARAQARRLCRDRGRVRRRSRRGEILRHQVPQGRAQTRRRSGRGDGARAQDARRRREGRARRRESRRAQIRPRQPRPAHRQRPQVRRAGRGRDQPVHRGHGGGTRSGPARGRRPVRRQGRGLRSLGARRRGRRGPGPRRGGDRGRRTARSSSCSIPTISACGTRRARSPARSTAPTTSSPTPASRRSFARSIPRATAFCRSASPRPSIRSPTTRRAMARRAGSTSR